MPSIHEMIRERRAIRRYEDRPVPAPLLHRLLESATWAPSAHNRQPWRFAVLTAFAAKERLAQAMGARLRQDRLADGDPPEAVDRQGNLRQEDRAQLDHGAGRADRAVERPGRRLTHVNSAMTPVVAVGAGDSVPGPALSETAGASPHGAA